MRPIRPIRVMALTASIAVATALAATGGDAQASSIAVVTISLEKVAATSDVVVLARVRALGLHRYPAQNAPGAAGDGVPDGLPYLDVEIEETLKPSAGGPKAGARVAIFDPNRKFAYEKSQAIKAGVVSYADAHYPSSVRADALKPGARLIFFLSRRDVPPHFPAGSLLMTCGTAYDRDSRKAAVTALLAAGARPGAAGPADRPGVNSAVRRREFRRPRPDGESEANTPRRD